MQADFLRTDHAHLRALQPSSATAQELKLLTEDCQRHIRQQTRLVNQLTATLKAYYPRALEVAELTTALAGRREVFVKAMIEVTSPLCFVPPAIDYR